MRVLCNAGRQAGNAGRETGNGGRETGNATQHREAGLVAPDEPRRAPRPEKGQGGEEHDAAALEEGGDLQGRVAAHAHGVAWSVGRRWAGGEEGGREGGRGTLWRSDQGFLIGPRRQFFQ